MTLTLEEARERFGGELERRLMEAVAEGGDDLLCRMSAFHLETGGKRLRGMIPLVVAANLGGDPEEALEIGVALELLHNATLVHDDLQDGDEVRRGAPAIWARWGAAQAINTGDALYFHGLARLARAPA
ncbi:MAG: polyprenyl synthetase family protein, partial [Myxococcota bacterium]|nr:polyprenyl synthetase family protein [Myxococcota bacterium]